MPRPQIDLATWIKRIPLHVVELPQEADTPLLHYKRSANDSWNLLLYVERNLAGSNLYPAPFERHLHHLSQMVLLGLVEAFERFLKETAAVCIDQVAQLVLDDRLNVFTTKGDVLGAHFGAGSLGKSLCESCTWVDCDQANERFRKILADPFTPGAFYVFPTAHQQPAVLAGKFEVMSIIWQLRHTIVHNAAVITASDARKLRLMIQQPVLAPRVLWPSRGDVWYVKLFLDDTAERINEQVGRRLAALLTILHAADPTLLQPADKAQELADLFQIQIQVAGIAQNPVP